jgi:hypothetical protein
MSGVLRPAAVPEDEISKDSPAWFEYFKRLIARNPQLEEVHLISTGIIYLGDSATNGSWRIVRSGDDLTFDRRESGSWVTKSTISA